MFIVLFIRVYCFALAVAVLEMYLCGKRLGMRPGNYKEHFIAAVMRRSGTCRSTVEQVLPAVFDEVRFQLTEGAGLVPIELETPYHKRYSKRFLKLFHFVNLIDS